MLTVIITTSRSVNMLVSEYDIEPKTILLKPLKPADSVKLFLDLANDVEPEEVYQLML